MSALIGLWLPILITTVVLFFASFLAWVISPHHKPDIRRWPDEDRRIHSCQQHRVNTCFR